MVESSGVEQTLSPSSSEILKRASKLVDQLLLRTSNEGLTTSNNICLGSSKDLNLSTNIDHLNCESSSIADSETLSALTSARKNVPSIEVIKKLAGRLKSRDSDTISEVNFSKRKPDFTNQDNIKYWEHSNENCRSKSASPVSKDYKKDIKSEFSQNFLQVNARLNEINKRVECLSNNIDDIRDSDDVDCLNKAITNNRDNYFNNKDYLISDKCHSRIENERPIEEGLSNLNVAVLQQERLRMWAKDNAKHSASISNSSEHGNNVESDHVPFSDVYYSQQSKNNEASTGVINSSILSTTVSGVTGQFAYSNDTTIYETRSNEKNCNSEFSKPIQDSVDENVSKDNFDKFSVDRETETNSTSIFNSSNMYCSKSCEPKTLRFIKVGTQLRRSITVTPLVEGLQKILSTEVESTDRLEYSQSLQVRRKFTNKLDKLSNSYTSYNSYSTNNYSNNMVIITIKDNGIKNQNPNYKTIDDVSSTSSGDSGDHYFFSCRECSWNPVNTCAIQ